MINLLPPKEKQRIDFEKKRKIAGIFWIFAIFYLISLICALYFVKTVIAKEIGGQGAKLEKLRLEYESSEAGAISKEIAGFNAAISRLDTFQKNKFYFSEVIAKTISILPPKASLIEVSAVNSENGGPGEMRVYIKGVAPSRESLFNFKKDLESAGFAKEIYFPPSNWVKATDADFSVSFKIVQDNGAEK